MKNWRTTAAGVIGAVVTYVINYVQTNQALDYKAMAIGAAMIALGYFSKDAGVTGTQK